MIPLTVAFFVYFNSWRIENDAAHQFAAMVSGLVLIVGTMLGAIVIYPLAYFMGAKPSERIIAALIPGIVFDLYEIYIVSEAFSFAESLYYGLNPVQITVFILALGSMGLCELLCRWITKLRGGEVRVLTPIPIVAIVVMLFELYIAFIWGNGGHFFNYYMKSYLFLFKS